MQIYDPKKMKTGSPRAAVENALSMGQLAGRSFMCACKEPIVLFCEDGVSVSYNAGDKVCVYIEDRKSYGEIQHYEHLECYCVPTDIYVDKSLGSAKYPMYETRIVTKETLALNAFKERWDVLERETLGVIAFQAIRDALPEYCNPVREEIEKVDADVRKWDKKSNACEATFTIAFVVAIGALLCFVGNYLCTPAIDRANVFSLAYGLSIAIPAAICVAMFALYAVVYNRTPYRDKSEILKPWYECIGVAMRKWFAMPEASTPGQCVKEAFLALTTEPVALPALVDNTIVDAT